MFGVRVLSVLQKPFVAPLWLCRQGGQPLNPNMSTPLRLFHRRKQCSVSHWGTNTNVAKESTNLCLHSVSYLSLKRTLWLPDPPSRDLVSGQYLQSPLESQQSPTAGGWWAMWEGLSHSPWLRSSWGSSSGRRLYPWIRRWPLSLCLHAGNLMNVSAKCCEVWL